MADRPELVIFDCDGVLVDSERITVEVEARLLAEYGWAITPEDIASRFVGRTKDAILAEVARQVGPERAAEFHDRSTAQIHEAWERELLPVEGIVALVEALRDSGLATCVASSGSHAKMRRTLGLTGLWDSFEGRIFSASEVARGKPAPDLFLHAARQSGSDPQRCVVVEDSVFGVQAAVGAGMAVYGYAGGLTPAARLAAAGAHPFDHMAELQPLLLG